MDAPNRHARPRPWAAVNRAAVATAVVVAFAGGYAVRWAFSPAPPVASNGQPGRAAAERPAVWTCSMHPSVRQPRPGKCPICHMDLILLETDPTGAGGDPRRISLSDNAKALMGVETVAVERKLVTAEVRMTGKVDYDETRLAYLTAWMPGRLDRLFVDYTGMPVRKGDHMVEIYSPELFSAQEEFLQARKSKGELKADDPKLVRESVEVSFDAAREKLRLLGLTAGQVDELARRGKASDRLTIYAPAGGIVVHMNARQGMYVQTGARLFTIADLSRVWVRLDAYESDLGWLRYGQAVEFSTDSLPGRTFHGMISFIDPVLTERTRTVRVRVTAANADGALKPGMFVRAVVRSRIAAGGKVSAPSLAGKWICPMHPEVVQPAPGKCDVCGMPLATAESLGYSVADPNEAPAPLVVPADAVLRTGKRAIVYVEVPGAREPTYEMRQVALGPRAGEHYLVERGLSAGERVVARGNFRLDSERQIRGLPSMMDSEGAGAPARAHGGHAPPPQTAPHTPAPAKTDAAFRRQLASVFAGYFAMARALAADDAPKAAAAAKTARAALAAVDAARLTGQVARHWKMHAGLIGKMLDSAAAAGKIEPLRADFALLSEQMIVLARRFGPPGKAVYQVRCPMAFNNRGATWLQLDENVRNPYFGDSMLQCGSVVATFRPPAGAATRPADKPAHERELEHN